MSEVNNEVTIAAELPPTEFNFHGAVKEAVAGKVSVVRDRLIDVYVEKELVKYQAALEAAITNLSAAKIELNKIKPDVVSYFGDGSVQSEGYSKAVLEQRKTAKEKVTKIEEAISLALNKNDYSKVLALKQ